jgi:tripartite-type tricarboxylate transporter receptor subunit TctC
MIDSRLLAAAAATFLAVPAAHAAQPAYPDKPIRLIIGSAPGSGPDIISRLMADRMYATWIQRVVVDARPGAAGVISAELALQANPDGYTWMMLTSQLLVASQVFKKVPFDLARDFQSISLIGTAPFVLVINPTVEAKSIPDLVALAKKSPGQLRYGSAGTGASEHLSGVQFTQLTGTNIVHVPYKGVPQAIADTLAKEVHFSFAVPPAALPHIQSGRLRALGVTTPKRSSVLPDVPAIGEFVPGYQMTAWYSIVAPRGTPGMVLDVVNTEVVKAARDAQFVERLKNLGIDPVGSTRAELDQFRAQQTKLIRELVKISGATVD